MTLWKKLKENWTKVIVSIIYFATTLYIAWIIIDTCLFVKDLYLFSTFQPYDVWIILLIGLLLLFGIFSYFAISFVFSKRTEKTVKKIVWRVVQWVMFLLTSCLCVFAVIFLAMATSFTCFSHTTDINNYLSFDSKEVSEPVVDYFPTKECVALLKANGADISYEYRFENGLLDSENVYTVVLDVQGINAQTYQMLKTDPVLRYTEVQTDNNGYMRIIVRNDSQKDMDGIVFTVIGEIEFNEATHGIKYSIVKQYPHRIESK